MQHSRGHIYKESVQSTVDIDIWVNRYPIEKVLGVDAIERREDLHRMWGSIYLWPTFNTRAIPQIYAKIISDFSHNSVIKATQ